MKIIALTDGAAGPYRVGDILIVDPDRDALSGEYVIYPDSADGGEIRL